MYHTKRAFQKITFTISGIPTAFKVCDMAGKLTTVVGPTNVVTNGCYATEYRSMVIEYETSDEAWAALVAGYPANSMVHTNYFDNVGWVKGLKQTEGGKWGGYIWLLQNTVNFKTSPTNVWVSTDGVTNSISKVLVGTIGDYSAMEMVEDTGPGTAEGLTNWPGGVSNDMSYTADFTAYYDIGLPGLPVIAIVPLLTNVCINSSNVIFTLNTNSYVPNGVTWSITPTDGVTWTNSASNIVISVGSVATSYVVRATANDNTNIFGLAVLNVIKVDLLQYEQPDGTWYDASSGTLYVLKGSTVTFKVVPTPLVTWPNGMPVWGGTAGASGAGETKAVAFNTLSTTLTDYKTVTATCGNTKTANIIVYDLTGTLTPDDNFAGRSQSKYGLEEQVDLGFSTDPAGITKDQAGGLVWTKNSGGVGSVSSPGDYGLGNYDAQNTAGNVTLRLTIQSGPSKDQFKSYDRTVVAPSGTRMTRATANVKHNQGTASAGIALYYWLDPTDVSFWNLTFGEDGCSATGATGIYITAPPGNHNQNTFGTILGGNSVTGCRVDDMDGAWTESYPWAPGGTFTWSIPAQYIDDTSTRHTFGTTQNHNPTIQVDGYTTMSKGEQSGSAAVTNLTSDY